MEQTKTCYYVMQLIDKTVAYFRATLYMYWCYVQKIIGRMYKNTKLDFKTIRPFTHML